MLSRSIHPLQALTTPHLLSTESSPTNQQRLFLCRGRKRNSTAGVDRDYSEALRWFRAAADKDLPNGQMELGHCFARPSSHAICLQPRRFREVARQVL
jgi:TPR repeat protein